MFLIDAGSSMQQLAALPPPGWPEAQPWPPPGGVYAPPPSCPASWRAVDLAVWLVQSTLRSKCVRGPLGGGALSPPQDCQRGE